jgi:probable selenium-dependent hydroxylase accessory protein YqeC
MTQLREALGVGRGDVVSFVGAGGKTTTAMRLMVELAEAGQPVVFTTTTKILEPVLAEDERLVLSEQPETILKIVPELLARRLKVFPLCMKTSTILFLSGPTSCRALRRKWWIG